MVVFWVLTECKIVSWYWNSNGICCLCLQDDGIGFM